MIICFVYILLDFNFKRLNLGIMEKNKKICSTCKAKEAVGKESRCRECRKEYDAARKVGSLDMKDWWKGYDRDSPMREVPQMMRISNY